MNLTPEEIDKKCKELFIIMLNDHNEKIFKAGGMALPRFENYSAYEAYKKLINKVFPPAKTKFSDLPEKTEIGEIVFNIDSKYLKKEPQGENSEVI